ncbi:hypothetical protein AYO44_14735 [Planctomycetaceae bacterium SCGC AG-212-F19]|nr:hypothetical protein AYO44_14735 [Planctomycetaceae bacterium SCGC AG-212-F19]
MAKRIAAVVGILLVIAIGVIVLVPTNRLRVVGWVRGEPFHRGMPLSHWLADLESPNGNLRYEAILAVGRNKDAMPSLIRRLKDDVPLLRHMAAVELARFGPEAHDAVPALTEMLADPDRACRQAAADALRAIAPGQVPTAKAS